MEADISKFKDNHLARNLEKFRSELGLSPAELASISNVNEKTIRNIENGMVKRPYPNTVLKLAQGLGKSPADLLNPVPASGSKPEPQGDQPVVFSSSESQWGRGGRLPWFLSAVAIMICAILFLRAYAIQWSQIQFSNEKITARDAILGLTLWKYESDSKFWFSEEHPDDPSILLVGLGQYDIDGGRLLALDRRTGGIIWQFSPDLTQLTDAFIPSDVTSGRFACRKIMFADLAGNGNRDLIVYFVHDKYYPSCLCRLASDGTFISQYSSFGHLNDIQALDFDADGKAEILAAGYNSSRLYRGGTVIFLDEDHFVGASVDSIANPQSGVHDGSLLRIVFPHYPESIMDAMSHRQLCAGDISFGSLMDGGLLVNVEVGIHQDERIIVAMDSQLRIMGSAIKDSFRDRILMAWPDSLAGELGPIDVEWRSRWLDGHIRFEDGKRAHTDHH